MNDRDEFFEARIFPDRRCWIGWKAYLAEHDGFESAEEASSVLLGARRRRELHELEWRLRAAVLGLPFGSDLLGGVLTELLILAGED
jgi:hypothetical protein